MGEPLSQGQHQPSSLHRLCLTPADREAKRDQFQTRKVFFFRWPGWVCSELSPSPLSPWGVAIPSRGRQRCGVSLCCSPPGSTDKPSVCSQPAFQQQTQEDQGQMVTVIICRPRVGFLLLYFGYCRVRGIKGEGLS